MRLILANAIINLDRIVSIYVENDTLRLERDDAAYIVKGAPADALPQIALAYAQDKTWVEFGDASLSLEENNDNQ